MFSREEVPWAQVSHELIRGVPQLEEAKLDIENEQLIHLVVHPCSSALRHCCDSTTLGTSGQIAAACSGPCHASIRNDFVKRIRVRWRSMKDLFNKDMRQENQVKSGAAQRILSKYKYHRNLAFLMPALATRT
ncbi:uncharacterized protein LOC143766614 isoform X2 [Ranitomeya variabilis]|uniref:uncharacterized protein LOC143766614 isoform X2 n=1 Tax=Ranitomeya variabilis TaxID=490064 RepID=UPI00405647F1